MERSKLTEKFPRDLAIRILTRVLSDHEPLDEAIAAEEGAITHPGTRAWIQEICSGTLRWKGRLEFIIDSVALKKKPTGWLRKMLMISTYQLLAQERTQPAPVVSEAVSEIKKASGEFPAKFANACLRKIANHAAEWRALAKPARASKDQLAAWASLPKWLWQRLEKEHGATWAEEFAKACLQRPTLWLRSHSESWKPEGWAKPGPIACSWQVIEGGAVTSKPGFKEGAFIVQDISSQTLVDEITSRVRSALGSGQLHALDLCAAPGGKSVGLAWNGFEVTATDRDERRISLLRQTLERIQHSPTVARVHIIGRDEVGALKPQDLVWVDAPCTGTGIVRRHPDVRWLRQEKEIQALTKLQKELLIEAWIKVRPGGFLAYSVCSVLKEEGLEVLNSLNFTAEMIHEWFLVPQNEPYGDGFWARLIRKPEY